jgi:activated CDC42 kinase 1
MAYEGLVESPSADVSQLMVTNPLRILRSGQVPVINPRTRSASVASTLPPKIHESVRNSVPENLNGTKTGVPPQSFQRQLTKKPSPDLSTDEPPPRQNFSSHTLPPPSTHFAHRDDNPIPLPPRDRNKTLLMAKPRHTRKHPLIIPPTNLQRTLDKINTVTPPATVTTDPFQSGDVPVYSNSVTQIADKNPESIHFEAQIESDLNALDEIPQEQDVVDGVSQGFAGTKVEDEGKLSSHHVSCEDLLKFANAKPSSRTRGIDSDEVRIMLKVLGKDVSKEKCVEALDQCEWEVMKAIKIVKLQNMVSAEMATCCNALDNSAWDVAKAAQWILQQDGEVTQV